MNIILNRFHDLCFKFIICKNTFFFRNTKKSRRSKKEFILYLLSSKEGFSL